MRIARPGRGRGDTGTDAGAGGSTGLPSGASHPARPRASEPWLLTVLSSLLAFASISTDLYLPAMPEIGDAFGADAGAVELTVSSYLTGFSLGQLLWGPIGDRYGRRLPMAMLTGLMVAVAAWTGWGGLWGLAVPLFLFVSVTGLLVANAVAGALSDFPERAGAVSALIGAVQYGGGIIGSALVGAGADGTPWPLGWVLALAGTGCLLSTRMLATAGALGTTTR